MELAGVTATDVCSTLKIPMPTFSDWINAKTYPRIDKIEMLANYFGILKSDLVEDKSDFIPLGFQPLPPMDSVPLIGQIACGEPILAEENIERVVSIPAEWRSSFTLICKGDSMAPRIQDGDLVAIRIQPMVENGEIAAVRIGDEATLKRVYLHNDYIELRPENPTFESIIRRRSDMEDVHIEGKAVGLCRGI